MALLKVISGGQTGVDQAALRAARDAGLAVGGWCPPGRLSEAGPIPEDSSLEETPAERSPLAPDVPRSMRTEWNVRDADATLVLCPPEQQGDPGTEWTLGAARMHGRPVLLCDPWDTDSAAKIGQWIAGQAIHTLNVAGPSERTAPGIGAKAYEILRPTLTRHDPAGLQDADHGAPTSYRPCPEPPGGAPKA